MRLRATRRVTRRGAARRHVIWRVRCQRQEKSAWRWKRRAHDDSHAAAPYAAPRLRRCCCLRRANATRAAARRVRRWHAHARMPVTVIRAKRETDLTTIDRRRLRRRRRRHTPRVRRGLPRPTHEALRWRRARAAMRDRGNDTRHCARTLLPLRVTHKLLVYIRHAHATRAFTNEGARASAVKQQTR